MVIIVRMGGASANGGDGSGRGAVDVVGLDHWFSMGRRAGRADTALARLALALLAGLVIRLIPGIGGGMVEGISIEGSRKLRVRERSGRSAMFFLEDRFEDTVVDEGCATGAIVLGPVKNHELVEVVGRN